MIKGIDLFRKDFIIYYVGCFILALLVGYSEGIDYLLQYISLLICLFVPSAIVIQLYVFINKFIMKKPFKLSEVISFIVCLMSFLISYILGLDKNQRLFILILNIVITSIILIVFLFLLVRNKR